MRKIAVILFILSAVFTSCGIEEYYYLPQLPENNITSNIRNAVIEIPNINSSQFYYATSYNIFYRIYLSDVEWTAIDRSQYSQISQALGTDFTSLFSVTDPTQTSSITNSTTFSSRSYFRLEMGDIDTIMHTRGGTINIEFSGAAGHIPTITYTNGTTVIQRELNRNRSEDWTPVPVNFLNTAEMREVTTNNNRDVSSRSNANIAYVSMYIVAEGSNPVNFSNLFSKPTHIGVFLLPE